MGGSAGRVNRGGLESKVIHRFDEKPVEGISGPETPFGAEASRAVAKLDVPTTRPRVNPSMWYNPESKQVWVLRSLARAVEGTGHAHPFFTNAYIIHTTEARTHPVFGRLLDASFDAENEELTLKLAGDRDLQPLKRRLENAVEYKLKLLVNQGKGYDIECRQTGSGVAPSYPVVTGLLQAATEMLAHLVKPENVGLHRAPVFMQVLENKCLLRPELTDQVKDWRKRRTL